MEEKTTKAAWEDNTMGGLIIKLYKKDDDIRLKGTIDVSTSSITDLI